jgi:hypothetical protein
MKLLGKDLVPDGLGYLRVLCPQRSDKSHPVPSQNVRPLKLIWKK